MARTPAPWRIGRLLLVVAAIVLLAAVGFWFSQRPRDAKAPPDMVEVLHLNNRGVGLIEQFQYDDAVAAFEKLVDVAPHWLPARINLGIALLNAASDESIARAQGIFEQVLQQEPDNPYAHHCLGLILEHQAKPAEAALHFEKVTTIDPNDADAWYHLGNALRDRASFAPPDSVDAKKDMDKAKECFERALKLDPCLIGPIYGLAMSLRQDDLSRAKKLFEEQTALRQAEWENLSGTKYTEMGRYGEVIGRVREDASRANSAPLPLFVRDDKMQVKLRTGARWATSSDLAQGTYGALRASLRARFGAVMVVLDYDRDGKPDIFLLGAVVRNGKVDDLLLRNEGDGRFTDVTEEAGLGGARPSLGCCVADYDNDGYPDLCITGIGEQHLFHNTGKGRFEDVSAQAGLDQVKTVCLGAAFVDLDQDGDLDLVVTQYAMADDARAASSRGQPPAGKGLAVFLNVGKAPAAAEGGKAPGLETHFRAFPGSASLVGEALPAINVAVSDLDVDHDVDLLVLADGNKPVAVLNDRLLRFHHADIPESLVPAARWNGALVLDANHDERSDLFLVGPDKRPVLLLRRQADGQENLAKWYDVGAVNSPPLLQAQAVDVDLDGWTDIVGLSDKHVPILLHNQRGKLVHVPDALGRDVEWPKDVVAIAAADFNNKGFADVLVWSETSGLRQLLNQGNGNHSLKVELSGIRETGRSRSNADGIGAWVVAQAGDLWTAAELATRSAGLGQSHQPLLLGLGPYKQADVLRIRWPDGTRQAVLDVPAGQTVRVEETNRKPTSCPVLFAWNGRRFGFVTDFLGAGSMGELEPDGGCRPPRPEESIKIEPDQLVPLDGRYVLKVAEPMDEAIYLDRLQLVVLDHPADMRVYPDERFVSSGPPASQDLLAVGKEIVPVEARDHRGRDVTQSLRAWDRDTVHGFAPRGWLGFAEEHWVELDFGARLSKFRPKDPLILCMAGWTDYAYPESIWAASQAGVAMQPPVLERHDADGKWQPIIADAGFPAGLPRMMTLDVTGKLTGARCVIRLRTNLQIYWDQVFVAPLLERMPHSRLAKESKQSGCFHATPLDVSEASLEVCGCAQEYSPDGREPTIYDHDRIDSVPVSRLSGKLTRTGNVTELLRDRDDRFVIFGPGEEVTVRFDAGALPALPSGWQRSFVLRTWGYCKDCSPFTATGDTIEPLPFHDMTSYPYGANESYPRDPLHEEYRRKFNTREAGGVHRREGRTRP
jgi:tetratricopeptide (TPR) repeat protein